MSLQEDKRMKKSFFYKSVETTMAILKQKSLNEQALVGPSLILIDNLGVATSSLNALAFAKTVIRRLAISDRAYPNLALLATPQTDLA